MVDYANDLRHIRVFLFFLPHLAYRFYCAENDSSYEGEFSDGRKHGGGRITFAPGGDVAEVEGTWANGDIDSVTHLVLDANSPWRNPDL